MQLYNDIKKSNGQDNQHKCEGDSEIDFENDDDESSCDHSYCSADDLPDADLKFIQGGILDVIKQFDNAFNPAALKDANELEAKQRKKLVKSDKDKSKDRKPKKKKEEKPKETSLSVPVQPFQLKMTGNGGNPCTLAMERILKERQEKYLLEQKIVSQSQKRASVETQKEGI